MQTKLGGTALTMRLAEQDILTKYALSVNRRYKELRETELAKTEEQKATSQKVQL
jgi:hypothetical protein